MINIVKILNIKDYIALRAFKKYNIYVYIGICTKLRCGMYDQHGLRDINLKGDFTRNYRPFKYYVEQVYCVNRISKYFYKLHCYYKLNKL